MLLRRINCSTLHASQRYPTLFPENDGEPEFKEKLETLCQGSGKRFEMLFVFQ
jgi:hypothetical protein